MRWHINCWYWYTILSSEGGIDGSIIGFDRSVGGIDTGTADANNFWNSRLCSFEWAVGTVGGAVDGAAIVKDGSNDEGPMSFADFTATNNGVAQGIKAMNFMYQKQQSMETVVI